MNPAADPEFLGRLLSEQGGALALYAAQWTDAAEDCVQEALVDMLVDATAEALDETGAERLVVSGGVSANRRLRERMAALGAERGVEVLVPRPALCTDNAAMIALAGWRRLAAGENDGLDVDAVASLPFGTPWEATAPQRTHA